MNLLKSSKMEILEQPATFRITNQLTQRTQVFASIYYTFQYIRYSSHQRNVSWYATVRTLPSNVFPYDGGAV